MRQVRLTANFRRTLDNIDAFLQEAGTADAFVPLLRDLFDTVIPNLERFPEMGHDLFAQPAGSVEVAHGLERLHILRASLRVREYVLPPYLLLYATDEEAVHLLAIRHHRQLSFDFAGLWGDV
jgi:plasmid stabilization system protein ParE